MNTSRIESEPAVQKVLGDIKAAQSEAATNIKSGIDAAFKGAEANIPSLSTDVKAAAESIIEAEAKNINPAAGAFVSGFMGLGDQAATPAFTALSTAAQHALAALSTRLDAYL